MRSVFKVSLFFFVCGGGDAFFFFFIRFPVLELTMTLDEVFFFPFFPFFFFGMVGELRYTRIHTFFDDQEFGPVFF